MPSLAGAMIGHMIGDYLLQNDFIANNKKRNSWVCALHCIAYAFTVVVCAQWPAWTLAPLFVTHFLIDRWQFVPAFMDAMGQQGFKKNLGPWSVIVVDNTMHLAILLVISHCVA